jgi:hypothetical protein
MVALYTSHDREVHKLRCAIDRQQRFADDAADERERNFHLARIADLQRELHQLQETEQ